MLVESLQLVKHTDSKLWLLRNSVMSSGSRGLTLPEKHGHLYFVPLFLGGIWPTIIPLDNQANLWPK